MCNIIDGQYEIIDPIECVMTMKGEAQLLMRNWR